MIKVVKRAKRLRTLIGPRSFSYSGFYGFFPRFPHRVLLLLLLLIFLYQEILWTGLIPILKGLNFSLAFLFYFFFFLWGCCIKNKTRFPPSLSFRSKSIVEKYKRGIELNRVSEFILWRAFTTYRCHLWGDVVTQISFSNICILNKGK